MKLSIVLPAYNESQNLRTVIEEIDEVRRIQLERYEPIEIIVVDDGSTDETAALLQELVEKISDLKAIVLRRNFGQSAALSAGIAEAEGEFVVTMDADGQNNPNDIPALLEEITNGYDCVSGWRRDRKDGLSKTIPSKIQTWLTKYTGPDIHDFGCTLKAYRASVFQDVNLHGEKHRYIPAQLHNLGYEITEIPVDHRPREHGSSNYGARRLLRGSVDLLFHIFWNRYSTRPMHFLGGAGLVILGVGIALGSHAVVIKYLFDVALLPRTPRLILTIGLVLFGFQVLMFGLLAEMITQIHYDSNPTYRIESVYSNSDPD